MKNKTLRFIIFSLILISFVCVTIFFFFAQNINKKNEKIIDYVGDLYMSGMNERITMHFNTMIDFQISHLSNIVDNLSEEEYKNNRELAESLFHDAKLSHFSHMGFISESGEYEKVYGNDIRLADPEPFLQSLKEGKSKMALGFCEDNESVMIIGVPASYEMKNGEKSLALVGAVSVNEYNTILTLDNKRDYVYSSVIINDGTYVIKNIYDNNDTYIDRLRYLGISEEKIDEYLDAMSQRKEYSIIMRVGDEYRHLYSTPLENTEWFLITIMTDNIMSETINGINKEILSNTIVCCSIIMAIFIIIFAMYLKITRRQIKELENARKEAMRATKAKSEFLSNMSHDIRTPMNAIVGMTAIATSNIDDKQQVRNCLRKITLSSKHLLGLINDVLDMSKIESGKMTLNMEQLSLREVMSNIVSIVQPQIKSKGQHFDIFIDNINVEDVYCDGVRLNQVILNLLSNAIKFTPEEGDIKVYLYEEDSDKGEDYVRVHIRIKDSGIGMSAEFKEHIFETFMREDKLRVHKTEGTGLGMPITKYIIDAMGGTIDVDSEQGKGTEFHVIVDLEKALVREEEMILPDWNMLVVDDDEQLCHSTIESLKEIGINAEWTLDGESALNIIQSRYEHNRGYEIILLDWKLPGIDGIETARRIRAQLGDDIPILLISAYDWSEIEQEAKAVGINGFISKPLFKSSLYYGLKQFVSEKEDDNSPVPTEHQEVEFMSKRIIIAEDNDLNWEIAEGLLSSFGLEIDRAENGKICLDKFSQSPIGYYSAILMDIRMPVMNGYESTVAIRKLNRADYDIPIIAMTADAFSDDMKKCLDCGMNAHTAKPIDIQEVVRLLQKYIK